MPHIWSRRVTCGTLDRNGGSAIDGRTTRHPGYEVSQRKRNASSSASAGARLIGPIRQVMVKGLDKVDQLLTLTMAATTSRGCGPWRNCARSALNEWQEGRNDPVQGAERPRNGSLAVALATSMGCMTSPIRIAMVELAFIGGNSTAC